MHRLLLVLPVIALSPSARSQSSTSILQQEYLKASNTDPNDQFGYAIAVDDDTMVVGAWGEQSNATGVNGTQGDNSMNSPGAAYVFVRNGTRWSQQAYLKASNTEGFDQFGCSVAISGDTIVVAARLESSGAQTINGNQADNSAWQAGAVYVFVRNGTAWTQQAYLKASNADAGDFFGQSVAISGDTVVVGAMHEGSSATGVGGNPADNSLPGAGAAYVFVRNGTTWSQQSYLKASNTGPDGFGTSVAISGDTILVGAPYEDSLPGLPADNTLTDSGAAYAFVRNGTNWTLQSILKGNTIREGLGQSVSVSGDRAVAGTYPSGAASPGRAHVFLRTGTVWSNQATLLPNNQDLLDEFGYSVSIAGERILVGAYREDSSATGVNGNGLDNSATDSGAAYVFDYQPASGSWVQAAYLKASNNGADDQFGHAVALSGTTAVVGARNEDSAATGVNGDQASNGAGDSGAAYVFDLRDECVGAVPLALGVNHVLVGAGATSSAPSMSCGFTVQDTWYCYTAAFSVPHTFDTCGAGTNFDTVLELYSGDCGALQSLACSDNACGLASSITAPLTQGVTYLLRLGGVATAAAAADIRVATGTGLGSVLPSSTVSLCPSTATLAVSGNPNIGGTITMTVNGFTGFPLTAYGFLPNVPIPSPCGCTVVSSVGGAAGGLFFGATIDLSIPSDASLIGLQAELQGFDVFPASGGCVVLGIPFGATDIATITVG